MYKLKFYSKSIFEHFFIPDICYRKRLSTIFSQAGEEEIKQAFKRVNYYFKRKDFFDLKDEDSNTLASLSCFNKSAYYYDIRSVLRYFPKEFKFKCLFGDIITVPDQPCFVKCRPIGENHENSAILKLNQVRHFREIQDPYKYEGKLDKLVWRGASYNNARDTFVKNLINNPFFDVGVTKGKSASLGKEFQKPFLSISQQLRYKFISSIEGNDVATNLKWIAQSNSLCFMHKPTHETWFMENLLIPDIHYVEIPEDLSDLPQKIKYFIDNSGEAKVIIKNFQEYYSKFLNIRNELLVALLVAVKYFFLSRQMSLDQLGLESFTNRFLSDK
jgi:hypothetical protein